MIQVSVRLFNVLADYAGSRHVELELAEGAVLTHVLTLLCDRYPPGFTAIVLPDGVPGPYLKVFRNGALVSLPLEECCLAYGDELMLFPAVAGGGAPGEAG